MRLSHSGISESTPVTSSSKHFVGCHALLRLWVPRYPPSSLHRLTFTIQLYLKLEEKVNPPFIATPFKHPSYLWR
jgi:hypothetical protein